MIVALRTMLSAIGAKDGAIFATAAIDAYYRTIGTQIARIAKI